MAFLLADPKSSKFHVMRYRDLDTGKWREKSLKLLRSDDRQTRQAQRECDKQSAKEAAVRPDRGGEFHVWVLGYLDRHFKAESSRRRYGIAWDRISEWLRLRTLRHPREIRYVHVEDYLEWRKTTGTARHNTALLEVKFFGSLITEAIRREFCETNPLLRTGVGKDPAAEKCELTDEDIALVRALLNRRRASWMKSVLEIMLYTGCRFSEAEFPLADVNFAVGTIALTDSKRNRSDDKKRYTIPMHDSLRAVLQKLVDEGLITTTPPLTRDFNDRFNSMLGSALGKERGITSHSLRVSFVTRCGRAGLTEVEAMNLVNHSTRLVHRIYSKLNSKDAKASLAKIAFPASASE